MLIATSQTVHTLSEENPAPTKILEGDVAALATGNNDSIVALKNGDLFIHAETSPQTVASGIEQPIKCLIIVDEEPPVEPFKGRPLRALIGTGESHIYRYDDGKTERVESFDRLSVRDKWYTPWGGPPDVRSFAKTTDGWVYADIHVGSIMRSPDRGETWEPVTPNLHEDVHQVATSPQVDERVYANTAHAVYVSDDRGQSWSHRAEGFPYYYGRAIAVHPNDPDCLLATVSTGPHGDAAGQLYRSDNAGKSWEHVTEGFPKTVAHNIDTFHIAFSQGGRAWAAVDHALYTSKDRGKSWESAWKAPHKIRMIA